jgi:hypothetical protein
VLGLDETASVEELVSAFRARIRAVHPAHHDGGGDRERLELLVRARQTLTGSDRAADLAERAARASAAPAPGVPRPSTADSRTARSAADDIMSRWAAAALRARAEWRPHAPQEASNAAADAAFREAERQAAATPEEVRRATAPTADIPERPFHPCQPEPRPVPKSWVPRYVQPSDQKAVFRPTPRASGRPDGENR